MNQFTYNRNFTHEDVKEILESKISRYFGVRPEEATKAQIYKAVILTSQRLCQLINILYKGAYYTNTGNVGQLFLHIFQSHRKTSSLKLFDNADRLLYARLNRLYRISICQYRKFLVQHS